MYKVGPKIASFRDLVAWQEAYQLTLMVYKATAKFPKEELFGLTLQIRRAVVSVASNIAEGFSRNSNKEKVHFYYIALGSLTEVRNQLDLAKGIGYLLQSDWMVLEDQGIKVDKLIHGLIKRCINVIPYT